MILRKSILKQTKSSKIMSSQWWSNLGNFKRRLKNTRTNWMRCKRKNSPWDSDSTMRKECWGLNMTMNNSLQRIDTNKDLSSWEIIMKEISKRWRTPTKWRRWRWRQGIEFKLSRRISRSTSSLRGLRKNWKKKNKGTANKWVNWKNSLPTPLQGSNKTSWNQKNKMNTKSKKLSNLRNNFMISRLP